MGDMLSLIEKDEAVVDKKKAKKLAKKIQKGSGFDLQDFKEQLEQMANMGGVGSLMDKLPGMGQMPKEAMAMADDGQIRRMVAIINSMTLQERRKPDIINGSRRKRIARGSGTNVSQVNKLLKQYRDMRRMMKQINAEGGLQEFGQKVLGGGSCV